MKFFQKKVGAVMHLHGFIITCASKYQSFLRSPHYSRSVILLIHGGAGTEPASQEPERLLRALNSGLGQKSAFGAVTEAISKLEEDDFWNAGCGAVLAEDGLPRLDASLALSSGESGAVANLLEISSPIRAAGMVLQSPYSLLAGRDAELWLQKEGMELSPAATRITKYQEDLWLRWQEGEIRDSLCTVGAVALDPGGNLAAGTSTGGLRGKHPARIGDSAIVGAGTWACSQCAISMTGDGDAILRRSSAARIALAIRSGVRPRRAIRRELRALRNEGAPAGCIVLLAGGRSWMEKNCQTLYSARFDGSGITIPKTG